MTNEEFNNFISKTVSNVLQDNLTQFLKIAFATGNNSPSPENISSSFACMAFAVKLSTLTTLEILKKLEVLNLDNFEFVPNNPDLKVILGGLSSSESEDLQKLLTPAPESTLK